MTRRQRGSGRGTDASGIDDLCLSGGSRPVLAAVAFARWGAQRESSSC